MIIKGELNEQNEIIGGYISSSILEAERFGKIIEELINARLYINSVR